MMYIINGVFFQRRNVAGKDSPDEEIGGTFNGIFNLNTQKNLDNCQGRMQDCFGESKLSDIKLIDSSLSFIKLYFDNIGIVKYTFKKKDNGWWEGEYVLSNGFKGSARCIITEISEKFYQPPSKT